MPQAPDSPTGVRIGVVDGELVLEPAADAATAELAWPDGVVVEIAGERVKGNSCRVDIDTPIRAYAPAIAARCDYLVRVSANRMEATLRVKREHGRRRTLVDREPGAAVLLAFAEEAVEPPEPDELSANAALQAEGVVYGIDDDAVRIAVAEPGGEHVVARGRAAVPGRNGYLQPLLDFERARVKGVLADTPLLRRVPRREGQRGRDVTGKELPVRAVRDARVRLGEGVEFDETGLLAVAALDGSPWWDGDAYVEVRHELVLEVVDTSTGDIDFCGSIHVTGDVGEGRKVSARHDLRVDGSVDRAELQSGGRMEVAGSIMSSVLRAGGKRALAASLYDRVSAVPTVLAEAATRARELRDAAEARGTEISHGLSLQLVLERMYRVQIDGLREVAEELAHAGDEYLHDADQFHRWHHLLRTAAVGNLGAARFTEILEELSRKVDDYRRAVEHASDLVVRYMQASEVEATGVVTISGKGVFNSRIVAWGGMRADDPHAVARGGSIVSHGPVQLAEIGSPGGSRMSVSLGGSATLDAGLVHAGTVVSGPGHVHRFIADRSHVHIALGDSGMNVESLAA